jgi:uncharacterized membrane protein YdfJ with MMPL/SSD domain
MASEELYRAVDSERTSMEGGSLLLITLGIAAMFAFWIAPLVNYVRFPSFSSPYNPFTIFFTFIWLGLLYLGFMMNRFASKIGQSLKRGAVSGAIALLDYFDGSYKLRRNLVLFDALIIFAFEAYELVGMSLSWLEWTEFSFAMDIFMIIFMLVMIILFVPLMNRWKTRNRARKRIEMIMEEYLQRQNGSVNHASTVQN